MHFIDILLLNILFCFISPLDIHYSVFNLPTVSLCSIFILVHSAETMLSSAIYFILRYKGFYFVFF